MSEAGAVPGTYTLVTVSEGHTYDVIESPDSVDAQTADHLSSCGSRDYWVHLTSTDGDRVRLRASSVIAIALCTPQGRARSLVIDRARDEEYKTNRAQAGYLPGDD